MGTPRGLATCLVWLSAIGCQVERMAWSVDDQGRVYVTSKESVYAVDADWNRAAKIFGQDGSTLNVARATADGNRIALAHTRDPKPHEPQGGVSIYDCAKKEILRSWTCEDSIYSIWWIDGGRSLLTLVFNKRSLTPEDKDLPTRLILIDPGKGPDRIICDGLWPSVAVSPSGDRFAVLKAIPPLRMGEDGSVRPAFVRLLEFDAANPAAPRRCVDFAGGGASQCAYLDDRRIAFNALPVKGTAESGSVLRSPEPSEALYTLDTRSGAVTRLCPLSSPLMAMEASPDGERISVIQGLGASWGLIVWDGQGNTLARVDEAYPLFEPLWLDVDTLLFARVLRPSTSETKVVLNRLRISTGEVKDMTETLESLQRHP